MAVDDASTALLWGVLHPTRVLSPALPAGSPSDEARAALRRWTEENPWLAALRRAGYHPHFDPRPLPVEEGDSSLNLNSHQALASLLASVRGAERGAPPLVLGNLASGNRALSHTSARWVRSFSDPGAAARAYDALLSGCGPMDHIERLLSEPRMAPARAAFRQHPRVKEQRVLRFPPSRFALPSADRLRAFLGAVGIDASGRVSHVLLGVHEALRATGLSTFADFMLVSRAALIHELGRLLGFRTIGHVPIALESLLGDEPSVGGRSLADFTREHHALLRHRSRPSVARRGAPTYRVLNFFEDERLLGESEKRVRGRHSDAAWDVLEATWDEGVIVGDQGGLAGRPVAALLGEGFGLSGKLLYYAVSRLGGGRICNLVVRPKPDVLAPFSTPHREHRVLPLADVRVVGSWTPKPYVLDLFPLMSWIDKSPDPRGVAHELFGAYSQMASSDHDGVIELREPGELKCTSAADR